MKHLCMFTERTISSRELMDEIEAGARVFNEIIVEGDVHINVTGIPSLTLNGIDFSGDLIINGRVEGDIELLNSVVRGTLVYQGIITCGSLSERGVKVLGDRRNWMKGEVLIED